MPDGPARVTRGVRAGEHLGGCDLVQGARKASKPLA